MRIGFVGDIQLASVIGRMGKEHDGRFAFAHMEWVFSDCDLVVGNMECCVVDKENHSEYRDNPFGVRPSSIDAIREAGIHVLNLANNHILDCGIESLTGTMAEADRAGVVHFGAGADLRGASAVREVDCEDRRLAFIGACDRSSYYAGSNRAGIMPMDRRLLGRRVREAVGRADLVTVCLHADLEFVRSPAPWRIRLCRWLIEQGAHLVVCHHPHVVQGVEEYGGGVIAYSLGNCVFRIQGNRYQEHHPDTDWGLFLGIDVEFGEEGVRVIPEFVPFDSSEEHLPVPLAGASARAKLEEIDRRSKLLREPVQVRHVWRMVCWREARRELLAVYYALRRREYSKALGGLRSIVREQESRRWVVGLLSGGYL